MWCRMSPKGRGFNPGLDHPANGKFCKPSIKWVPNLKGDKLQPSYAILKIQRGSNHHCPYGH